MPDYTGKLTEAEASLAQEWLRQKWGNPKCPFSGHRDWEIGEVLAAAKPYALTFSPNVPTYPYIVVMCRGCGYSAFVNAILAGVVKVSPTSPAWAPPRTPDI